MNIILFYFSGTGNSLTMAMELKQELKDCELVPIAKAMKNENFTFKNEKRTMRDERGIFSYFAFIFHFLLSAV